MSKKQTMDYMTMNYYFTFWLIVAFIILATLVRPY